MIVCDAVGATDTAIVCVCDACIWICCACACSDVDDISSGSFFTVTVCNVVVTLLLVPRNKKIYLNNNQQNQSIKIKFHFILFYLLLRSFLMPGFEKCLNSKWRRRLRDCLITAPHIGQDAGCSDCDRDFVSKPLSRRNLIKIFEKKKIHCFFFH